MSVTSRTAGSGSLGHGEAHPPVERLLRNRTGSRSSTVGPAVTTTRKPSRSRRAKQPQRRRDDLLRLGQPTHARFARSQRPRNRPNEPHPPVALAASRRCAASRGGSTCACAWRGREAPAHARTAPARRPDRWRDPAARRASISAVAGAMSTRSTSRPISTCTSPAYAGIEHVASGPWRHRCQTT